MIFHLEVPFFALHFRNKRLGASRVRLFFQKELNNFNIDFPLPYAPMEVINFYLEVTCEMKNLTLLL